MADILSLDARSDQVDLEPDRGVSIERAVRSPNVAAYLDDEYLARLGRMVVDEYRNDEESRSDWATRMAAAQEAALQLTEPKSFPWEGAANVAFPLVAIAAIQYHASAYPALINDPIVRYQVFGDDPDGKRAAMGSVVSQHMSWQLTEQDRGWEDGMDRALIVQPIMGCTFKKPYYDPIKRHNVSDMVMPADLVVPYYAKSIADSPRVSHCLWFTDNQIYERVQSGLWRDISYGSTADAARTYDERPLAVSSERTQKTHEVRRDSSRPHRFIEQHRYLDLDRDGYAEPYIVMVEEATARVARVVARFGSQAVQWRTDTRVKRIEPETWFVKIPFIPSPDGGFYDLGFGALLYPLNAAISTMINQIIDAGTLQNLGGGFLGRGAKMRRGQKMISAGQWLQVDSTGDDLRKSIMPLPTPQISPVLLDAIKLLIDYAERLAHATDEMVGKTPGQNTPAETSRNTMAQGYRVLNGIHKRTYRALKEEFSILYRCNANFLEADDKNPFHATAEAYAMDPMGIRPAADPSVMNEQQEITKLEVLSMSPQAWAYNPQEIAERRLKALRMPNPSKLMQPNAQPPPNPKAMSEQTKQAVAKTKDDKAKFDMKAKAMELQRENQDSQAKRQQLLADAALKVSQAKGEEVGHLIALIDSVIAENKRQDDKQSASIDALIRMAEVHQAGQEAAGAQGNGGGVEGVAGGSGDAGAAGTPSG